MRSIHSSVRDIHDDDDDDDDNDDDDACVRVRAFGDRSRVERNGGDVVVVVEIGVETGVETGPTDRDGVSQLWRWRWEDDVVERGVRVRGLWIRLQGGFRGVAEIVQVPDV